MVLNLIRDPVTGEPFFSETAIVSKKDIALLDQFMSI